MQATGGIKLIDSGSKAVFPTSWEELESGASDASLAASKAHAVGSGMSTVGEFVAVMNVSGGRQAFTVHCVVACSLTFSVREVAGGSHEVDYSSTAQKLRFGTGAASRLSLRLMPGTRAIAGERTQLQVAATQHTRPLCWLIRALLLQVVASDKHGNASVDNNERQSLQCKVMAHSHARPLAHKRTPHARKHALARMRAHTTTSLVLCRVIR